jgi:hypothetical protein
MSGLGDKPAKPEHTLDPKPRMGVLESRGAAVTPPVPKTFWGKVKKWWKDIKIQRK